MMTPVFGRIFEINNSTQPENSEGRTAFRMIKRWPNKDCRRCTGREPDVRKLHEIAGKEFVEDSTCQKFQVAFEGSNLIWFVAHVFRVPQWDDDTR